MTVHLEYAAYHDLYYTDHPGLPVSATSLQSVRYEPCTSISHSQERKH